MTQGLNGNVEATAGDILGRLIGGGNVDAGIKKTKAM